jgi:hypothetical protein
MSTEETEKIIAFPVAYRILPEVEMLFIEGKESLSI